MQGCGIESWRLSLLGSLNWIERYDLILLLIVTGTIFLDARTSRPHFA
jgi:hypothetical protein